MENIKCPACWKEIDSDSGQCPFCGLLLKGTFSPNRYANDFEITFENDESVSTAPKNTEQNKKNNPLEYLKSIKPKNPYVVIIAVASVILLVLLFGSLGNTKEKHKKKSYKTDYSTDYESEYNYDYGYAATGKEGALNKALSYLRTSAFSYSGLIEQLEFEGFTHEEAEYGASKCGADWKEQALLKAMSYLDTSSFSKSGLKEQLEFEGFTHEEAEYGVDNCRANWREQAAKKAKSYLSHSSFSKSELKEQLKYEGFSSEEANYGVEQSGL